LSLCGVKRYAVPLNRFDGLFAGHSLDIIVIPPEGAQVFKLTIGDLPRCGRSPGTFCSPVSGAQHCFDPIPHVLQTIFG